MFLMARSPASTLPSLAQGIRVLEVAAPPTLGAPTSDGVSGRIRHPSDVPLITFPHPGAMADILIIGGGIGGLCGGMLLARDGHRVRVLERDPQPPPTSPEETWNGWQRRGVSQFRLLHAFLPRFRELLDAELPDVSPALVADGAYSFNRLLSLPEAVTGGVRPGDERFASLTGRRPMVEGTLARLAAAEPGLEIRRGVGVRGLLTAPRSPGGIPRVIGVTTEGGDEMYADLVVDAGGSALGGLAVARRRRRPGAAGRARRRRVRVLRPALPLPDGSVPVALGPPVQPYESITMVTLPADNGTWGVGFVASAKDVALRVPAAPTCGSASCAATRSSPTGSRASRSPTST